MKFMSKSLAALAVVSLAAAQPAVAATRSADALPTAVTQIDGFERAGASVAEAEEAGLQIPLALIILAFGAAALVVAIIESNGGEVVDSPG